MPVRRATGRALPPASPVSRSFIMPADPTQPGLEAIAPDPIIPGAWGDWPYQKIDAYSRRYGRAPIMCLDDDSYVVYPCTYFGITGDDGANIETARIAAGPGGLVRLIAGTYDQMATPFGMALGGDVRGVSAQDPVNYGNNGTVLYPTSAFAGAGVITLTDINHAVTQGPGIFSLAVNGARLPGTTINLIDATGPVINVRMDQVVLESGPNWAIQTHADASVASGNQHPYQWYVGDITMRQCAGGGLIAVTMTDSEWGRVRIRSCGANGNHGAVIQDWQNSKIGQLRAEWTPVNHGVHITGAWSTGTGAGGMQIGLLSTDRNNGHGVLIDATGNSPLSIGNLMCRRDGRQGGAGGGGFAGLAVVGSGLPLAIACMTNFPGVDDTGTGANSPDYGLKLVATNTLVAIGQAVLQGQLAGLNGASGLSNRNLWGASGSTSAPSAWALTPDSA